MWQFTLLHLLVFYVKSAFLQLDPGFDMSQLSPAQARVVELARAGDANALNTLGTALRGRSIFGPPNEHLSTQYFHQSAERGNIKAAYNLGICYAEGTGVDQSNSNSFHWFTVAANGRHQGALTLAITLNPIP